MKLILIKGFFFLMLPFKHDLHTQAEESGSILSKTVLTSVITPYLLWHSLCYTIPWTRSITWYHVYRVKVIIRSKKDLSKRRKIKYSVVKTEDSDERFVWFPQSRLYVVYYLERCLRWGWEISGLYLFIHHLSPLCLSSSLTVSLSLASFRLQGCWKERLRKACECH